MADVMDRPNEAAATQELDPRRWIALGVVLTASFMVLLDISIVNVAIPSIQRNLKATFAQIQLVLALYQLGYAVVLITGGRLGDIYGRKRMFMIGMSGFILASALCGFAQSPEMLVGSRVLQGLSASLMYPQVLSVIQVSFPPRERPTAFAIFGAIIGLATIAGPLLGGILIQWSPFGLDWRPIFLVNLPIGLIALTAAWYLLHESRSPRALKLDLLGVVIVSAGLFLFIWPLVEGREAGWPLWAFICLIASLPVLVVFILFERWKTAQDSSPLLVLSLFHDRSFVVGLGISFLFLAAVPAFFLTFSLYIQIGLGFSALHAGLTTVPYSVGSFIASIASARAAARLGRNVLFIGNAILIAGSLLIILTIHLSGTGLSGPELIPAFFVSGIGLGAVIAPLINVILSGVHSGDAGSASGALTTIQQVGGAVGVAVIGVIFFGLLSSQAGSIGRDLAPGMRQSLLAQHVPPARATAIVRGFQRCFHDRASESDPTVVPASCPRPQPGNPVYGVVSRTATMARERDFSDAFVLSLLFNIACFAATFLLVSQLPKPSAATLGRAVPAPVGE